MPQTNHNQQSSTNEIFIPLFEQLEPFFVDIFGEQRKLSLMKKCLLQESITNFMNIHGSDKWEHCFSLLKDRIKKEVDLLFEDLKQFQDDEKFIERIDRVSDILKYAHGQICWLLKPFNFIISLYKSELESCCLDRFVKKVHDEFGIQYQIPEQK